MINTKLFFDCLKENGIDSFYGVPDSLLKEFCSCVTDNCDNNHNIITANEGNALALATGHYLATSRPAVVYMQNSGLGNIVNPLLSLVDEDVYKIPALLLIGWRGEPQTKDEPQHIKQGKLTLPLLETMGVEYSILENISQITKACEYMSKTNKPYAFVVRKCTFDNYQRDIKPNGYILGRESAISKVLSKLGSKDAIVSTTGMISREVYENRESHEKDFLTVGSMGHASSIALGIALSLENKMVVCLDGDGAVIMHLGALGVIGASQPKNFKHIIFNNEVHDSVGSQPTVAHCMNFSKIALNCGYNKTFVVHSLDEIDSVWDEFYNNNYLNLLEIRVKMGARKDLGRPKEKPVENKKNFMEFLRQ